MKTFPIALANHIAQPTTTLAWCLKITRQDGVVFGLTEVDIGFDIGGVTYHPGFTCSDWATSATLDVENQEVTVLPGTTILTEEELAAGIWDNAAFEVFFVNHRSLSDGVSLSRRGRTGQAKLFVTTWTIEFRGLKQALQQPLGAVTSKTCRAELGDAKCTVDLTPFTFTETVTAVTSRQIFEASGLTQADEWFVEGLITFTGGLNANPAYRRKVKVFSGGVITLTLAMPFEVQIGDTFVILTGCQKRHERTIDNPTGVSDCIDKFDNVLNFQGEPHLVGVDALTSLPDVAG